MSEHAAHTALKHVETCQGVGTLSRDGQSFTDIGYAIDRYQGMASSGLPIPGVHRVEGTVELLTVPESARRVGANFALTLADGRVIGVTLADSGGRVLTEGHGPSRCTCC